MSTKHLLIVFDHWDATRFQSDHWATASWFFGPGGKFLKAIATMAVIQPNPDEGELYVETLTDTALDLIGYRCDDRDEANPAPDLDEDQRQEVVNYLVECNRAMRPYLPNGGTNVLHSYITDPNYNELYLIIKHHDDAEHPDTSGFGCGIRSVKTAG